MRFSAIAILALLASAAGAATPATDPALNVYAKPQRLVSLPGGRKIHLFCMGRGSPSVILSAGQDGWATSWSKVQPSLAKQTRACSWDRAGYGFSDGSPKVQTAANTTADLALALKAAGIGGPYVMVGHSAGSFETLLFADGHKREVVGMVLADPSIPGQSARFAAVSPRGAEANRRDTAQHVAQLRGCAEKLAGAGLSDSQVAQCFSYRAEFPPALVTALTKRDHDPARLRSQASLDEQFDANSRQVADPHRDYGDMPLVVLTAANSMAGLPPEARADADSLYAVFRQGHDELAALSRRGVNKIVEGSGHSIQRDKPEAVIAAVEEVLAAARSR